MCIFSFLLHVCLYLGRRCCWSRTRTRFWTSSIFFEGTLLRKQFQELECMEFISTGWDITWRLQDSCFKATEDSKRSGCLSSWFTGAALANIHVAFDYMCPLPRMLKDWIRRFLSRCSDRDDDNNKLRVRRSSTRVWKSFVCIREQANIY